MVGARLRLMIEIASFFFAQVKLKSWWHMQQMPTKITSPFLNKKLVK